MKPCKQDDNAHTIAILNTIYANNIDIEWRPS